MNNKSEYCKTGSFYEIKKGESLSSISRKFGMTLNELLLSNPYLDPGYYVVGQIIVIPFGCECMKHIVQENETLADILRRYDTDAKTVRKLNPNADILALSNGQVILVPEQSSDNDYIIRKDDTLSSISRSFGIDITELLRKNPCLMPKDFLPGQGIKL